MDSRPSITHLVDDDPSFLKATRRLLELSGYTVRSFSSAAEFLEQHGPDVRGCVLLDLQMPGLSGLDLQSELVRTRNPLPIVFLTAHGDVRSSVIATKLGAEDFLLKPVPKASLLGAVDAALVRDQEEFARREQDRRSRERLDSLTPRERQVLEQVLAGKLNKQIAAELATTERTVKAHRAAIMKKLGASTPAELGRIAHDAGSPPGR